MFGLDVEVHLKKNDCINRAGLLENVTLFRRAWARLSTSFEHLSTVGVKLAGAPVE